jgi:hypothetical protein
MSEQPRTGAQEPPDDAEQEAGPPREPWAHVRTEGETAVDDALGGADDPS